MLCSMHEKSNSRALPLKNFVKMEEAEMPRKAFADTFGFTGCWESTKMYCGILIPKGLFKIHGYFIKTFHVKCLLNTDDFVVKSSRSRTTL